LPMNGQAVGPQPDNATGATGCKTVASAIQLSSIASKNQSTLSTLLANGCVGSSAINKLSAGVNIEATQKYIVILQEKIREYERALDGVRAQLKSQASRAVVELDGCLSTDCARQERTKRRLEQEHGELKAKAHKLQRTVKKLQYKLADLRANGIPIDVVPDDYVRQLQQHRDAGVAEPAISSSASSVSAVHRQNPAAFAATSASALNSVVHRTASSSDLLPGPSRRQPAEDPEPNPANVDNSNNGVGDAAPSVAMGRFSDADRLTLSSSDPSAPLISTSPPSLPLIQSQQSSSLLLPANSSAGNSSSAESVEQLRLYYERRLIEQQAAFAAELDSLRLRASDEAGDIQRLVDTELKNLRYDQQELAASADDGHKELEKMKVFLTNLSKEMSRMLLVDQQIDDMNNRLAVITRDLVQSHQSACSSHHHHNRPDAGQGGAASARLLNMLVALLSYAFVAASCLVNLLIWLLRLPGSRPFSAACLTVCAAPLLILWLGGDGGGVWLAQTLPDLIVRHLPLSARRQLSNLLLRLNATLA
ncbi:hypothetical protein BOX15_Mlig003037g2, partial [Macrostomum lignano]